MPKRGNWTGPQPDWASVEWFIYAVDVNAETTRYRVLPRELSAGEKRPYAERLVATVKRCSLRTVRTHLKIGAAPAIIQSLVDADAERQSRRAAPGRNTYREFCDRLKRGDKKVA